MIGLLIRTARFFHFFSFFFSLMFILVKTTSLDLVPVRWACLDLLEEVDMDLGRLVALVWVNVEAGDTINDDLSRPTIACGECGQTAGHDLNHGETESLIEGRQDEGTLGFTNVSVELTVADPVHLG